MNKRMSNKLFLLALCMQYGAGKIVAKQGTMQFAQVEALEEFNYTGRLLKIESKVQTLTDNQLESIEHSLHQISSVLDGHHKLSFKKSKLVKEKKEHVQRKIKRIIESLEALRAEKEKLSASEKKKVSSSLKSMEEAVSSKSKVSKK